MSPVPRRGFTLIELLVIVLIIAILAALMFPAQRRVSGAAQRVACQNNLKQLMIGLHTYADAHGAYPPGCVGPGSAPEARLSWLVPLLPHIEQDALFKKFDLTTGYADNRDAAAAPVRTFVCFAQPTAPGDAVAHYVALAGIGHAAAARPPEAPGNGFVGYDRATKREWLKDGAANTLALIETRANVGPWAAGGASNVRGFRPEDAPHIGEGRAFGWHPSGANAAMADGSVRFLSATTDAAKLAAAITLAGNETRTLD